VATREDREPRTVLEHLIRQKDRTYEEAAADFMATARSLNERVTISPRHLARLARGERGGMGTTPATRRVLQQMFGLPAPELLQPWINAGGPRDPLPDAQSRETAWCRPGDERRLLTMAAKRARRFTLTAGQAGATAEVIEQLREDMRHLAVTYQQRPLVEILSEMIEAQETVFNLLEHRQPPQQARELYLLGAVIGGVLAKASHDMADSHAAMTQARTAFICADNADHNGARAWLRGIQSLIAYWAGRHRDAIRYAVSGNEYAVNSRNTTMVWLPMSEARAWAALGNRDQTWNAVRRAEEARHDVRADEIDELGGLCTFSSARQLYYAADAFSWLPEESAATERYSAQAVTAYQDDTRPEWAFGDQAGSHTALAIAHVRNAETEGAIEAVAPVLDLGSEQRIHGIVHSTLRLHRAVIDARLAEDARELLDRIEEFTRTPASALTR